MNFGFLPAKQISYVILIVESHKFDAPRTRGLPMMSAVSEPPKSASDSSGCLGRSMEHQPSEGAPLISYLFHLSHLFHFGASTYHLINPSHLI